MPKPKNTLPATYDAPAFLQRHMLPPPSQMLKQDFGHFFIVQVQDMIKLMKLPVPPSKSVAHTCIFLTGGKAEMTVGNTRYIVKKNEILFVPAGSVFSFDKYDLNKGFLLHFKNDFLFGKNARQTQFEFLRVWGQSYFRLGKNSAAAVLYLCQKLYAEYSTQGLQHSALMHPYLMALLAEVNRVYKPQVHPHQAGALHITQRFRELLFANIRYLHRVSDYAEKIHVTPNHLNKCVKSTTGKSPIQWIEEAVILEAKALLCQSDLTVSEVALAVGHHDPSYFTRLFKKHTGSSPVAYRKMIEKSW